MVRFKVDCCIVVQDSRYIIPKKQSVKDKSCIALTAYDCPVLSKEMRELIGMNAENQVFLGECHKISMSS